jgi:hypothetical protein
VERKKVINANLVNVSQTLAVQKRNLKVVALENLTILVALLAQTLAAVIEGLVVAAIEEGINSFFVGPCSSPRQSEATRNLLVKSRKIASPDEKSVSQ